MSGSPIVCLICSDVEWDQLLSFFPDAKPSRGPGCDWFVASPGSYAAEVVFLRTGWGKIAAAASTQYAISTFHPSTVVNLGTCGGFAGCVDRSEILLADRTVVYDIIERMADPEAALEHFATTLDLGWLEGPLPGHVRVALLVSADRDLGPEDVKYLREKYDAIAGDWESGAIAYVARKNRVKCLILRGVSDLVGSSGGEADGDIEFFARGALMVLGELLRVLPEWIDVIMRSEQVNRQRHELPVPELL